MPTDLPPFIATQKLYSLRLDDHERLDTRGFLLQGALPESDAPSNEESSSNSQLSHWVHEPKRYGFLANKKRRLLCITVSAGIGKTKALEQFVIAQQKQHPERLVIRLHVSRLPDSWEDLLDRQQPILADIVMEQIGETDQDRSQKKIPIKNKSIVAQWLRSLARIGNLTLAIDGLDEIDQVKGEAKTQALKVFLEKHPRVGCTVAGRPYSITNYYWPLFSNNKVGTEPGPSSDWEFCLIGTFEKHEVEQYLGADLYGNVAGFLDANMLFVPRTLEMLRRLKPQEANSIRSAADVYWRSIEKTLTEDIAKPGLAKQTYLSQNEIIDMLSAVAVTMVMWNHDPLVPSIRKREEAWTEKRDGMFPCSPVRQIGKTDYEFLKTLFIERIQSIYPKWDDSKCEKNLDTLIKINSSFVEFAFFNSADANHVDWRNASVRDFFAALWMVRSSNQDEQLWLARRQSKVLSYPANASRYSELNDIWKFVCGIPDVAFLRRRDEFGNDGRWLSLIERLFSHGSHVRATELMYAAWPNLLRRAGYDLPVDWTEKDLLLATQSAQVGASISTPRKQVSLDTSSSTTRKQVVLSADSIVNTFLGEFLAMSAPNHANHAILHEDMGDHLFRDCGSYADLEFQCGHEEENDNREQDRTLAEGFRLCAYQVTNRLYRCFDEHHENWFNRDEVEYKYKDYSPYPRGPAIYLSWYDAVMFATWGHSRLPTEWEWEYACRANKTRGDGHNTVFYWGDDEDELERHAWVRENSKEIESVDVRVNGMHAHTVGTRAADHPYHLHDMLGNVWEWCSNRYHEDGVFRSCRGGSFSVLAIYTRCSFRDRSVPSDAIQCYGVRLARAELRKS